MEIRILGAHECESRNSKCISLLIDDVLAIDAGGLTSSLSFPAQRKLEALLITHQHYDHIKDIPTLAINLSLQEASIKIYSTPQVHDILKTHMLNGKLYPKFFEHPPKNPTIKFTRIDPYEVEQIAGYSVLAVPVNHTAPTLGYQITSPNGKTVFYTADTGPGLAECWKYVSPHLIIIEVTAPNRYEGFARESNHLTPSLLKQELSSFQELKGYLPRVIMVHMNPLLEKEIEAEIATLAEASNNSIAMAYEGMRLQL